MRNLFVVFLGVVLAFPSFGVKEYYSLSKSIRSLGMGGAFYGLSDDEYSLFSNPAGLSLRRSGTEVMLRVNGHVSSNALSGFNDFSGLSGKGLDAAITALDKHKGKPFYGNIGALPYFVKKNLAVGLLIADTKLSFNISKGKAEINNIQNNNPQDLPTTEVADLTFISDSGVVLGYAQSLIDPNLHIGANLKGLARLGGRKAFTAKNVVDNNSIKFDAAQIGGTGIGVDLDLGATYEMDSLPFGIVSRASLVLSNLLATDFSISRQYGAPPRLARTANLGWYTVFDGFAFIDNVHALVDVANISLGGETNPDLGARSGSLMKKLHLGLELPMGRFSVRAGLNQGYLTAGLGLNLYAVRLDLATYGEEIGLDNRQGSRRYALTAAFGWGSAPPAPLAPRVKESETPTSGVTNES